MCHKMHGKKFLAHFRIHPARSLLSQNDLYLLISPHSLSLDILNILKTKKQFMFLIFILSISENHMASRGIEL
jgi:hypothetical protein